MVLDICLDCSMVRQSNGELHHYCPTCGKFTWHAIIQEGYRTNGYRKEDLDLENFYAGGL